MERDEAEQMRLMFAGIALPGIIGRASMFETPQQTAEKAFDIADAMLGEYTRRINQEEEEQDEYTSSNNTETASN